MESENENPPTEDTPAPLEQDSKPRPMKSLSGQEWETYRGLIRDLYNRMPLKKVMAYMAETYNFIATARMYKTRLNQWGVNKYMKSQDMKTLVHRIQGSKLSDLPTEFEIDGKHIPRSKVARYAKRQGQALNSSSRTPESIGAEYVLVDSDGHDTDAPSDRPSPTTTTTTQAASPTPIDQLTHTPRMFPTFLRDLRSPFAESPEVAEGFCPCAPPPRTRNLQNLMQTDTVQQSLLLAITLSAMIQQRPLGDFSEVRPDALQQQATLDMNVFTTIVDLLGWLQLDRQVILLAAVYLVRFDASTTFPKSHNVWQQLLVALKFAQIHLHDEPYSGPTWTHAVPQLANSSIGQGTLEMDVLSDEHIRLHVDQTNWKFLETRLTHISTLLLISFERGIFTFEITQQRSGGGPIELTSSGFL
jgi:hypothetical protein